MTEDLRLQVMTLENIGLVYLCAGLEAALHHAEASVAGCGVGWLDAARRRDPPAPDSGERTRRRACIHAGARIRTSLQTLTARAPLPVELRGPTAGRRRSMGLPSDGEQQ